MPSSLHEDSPSGVNPDRDKTALKSTRAYVSIELYERIEADLRKLGEQAKVIEAETIKAERGADSGYWEEWISALERESDTVQIMEDMYGVELEKLLRVVSTLPHVPDELRLRHDQILANLHPDVKDPAAEIEVTKQELKKKEQDLQESREMEAALEGVEDMEDGLQELQDNMGLLKGKIDALKSYIRSMEALERLRSLPKSELASLSESGRTSHKSEPGSMSPLERISVHPTTLGEMDEEIRNLKRRLKQVAHTSTDTEEIDKQMTRVSLRSSEWTKLNRKKLDLQADQANIGNIGRQLKRLKQDRDNLRTRSAAVPSASGSAGAAYSQYFQGLIQQVDTNVAKTLELLEAIKKKPPTDATKEEEKRLSTYHAKLVGKMVFYINALNNQRYESVTPKSSQGDARSRTRSQSARSSEGQRSGSIPPYFKTSSRGRSGSRAGSPRIIDPIQEMIDEEEKELNRVNTALGKHARFDNLSKTMGHGTTERKLRAEYSNHHNERVIERCELLSLLRSCHQKLASLIPLGSTELPGPYPRQAGSSAGASDESRGRRRAASDLSMGLSTSRAVSLTREGSNRGGSKPHELRGRSMSASRRKGASHRDPPSRSKSGPSRKRVATPPLWIRDDVRKALDDINKAFPNDV